MTPKHPAHQDCMRLFYAEIRGGEGTMALAPQVLGEFCHVVTTEWRDFGLYGVFEVDQMG